MSKESRKRNAKFRLQRKMKRFIEVDNLKEMPTNLKKSIDNVVTVSDSGLRAKADKLEFSNITEAMLLANSPEFKPYISQYCNKSGKFLHNVSLERFGDMLNIHGKDKTLKLLTMLHSSNYSLEWIDTSPSVLNKLMIQDCSGFFIYAANHLFELFDPYSKTVQKFKGVPEAYKKSYLRLKDKIHARKDLDFLIDQSEENRQLILQANELMRRLIGLARPTKTMMVTFFTFNSLLACTNDKKSLQIFIQDIKENLTFLLQRHFKKIKNSIFIENKNLYRITANDIEKIKNELEGLSSFHNQPSIKNQSKRTSIMMDLKGFIVEEFGEAELWEDEDFEYIEKDKPLNHHKLDDAFMGLNLGLKQHDNIEEEKQQKLSSLKVEAEEIEKPIQAPIKSTGFKLNIKGNQI